MPNAAFTTLINDVYTITKRSDLVAETSVAVRAATLKLHQMEFFPRDLSESKVNFSVADFYQTLPYATLFPQFRALSYLRKYEGGAPTQVIDVIQPTDILDSYGISKENVAYMAGAVIQIRSNTKIETVLLGFYNNPITGPDTYASWIGTNHPFAVINEAAATVFKMIGFDEQASTYRQLAAESALHVKNFNLNAEGY